MSITPFFHVYHKYVFNMDNISKIKISGTSYSIKDENACKVVELTQAEYNDLPTTAKTSNSLFVITDATAGDLSNYYTKTETDNAITAATSTKQDTLVSGTNIKTINGETLLGEGNITIEGGGGGKAIEAGRGISVTTGETADTVSLNLPISAGTGTNSIIEGNSTSAMSSSDHAEGYQTYANGNGYVAHAEGYQTSAMTPSSHAEGRNTKANGNNSHAEGLNTTASGECSHAEGLGSVASSYCSHAEGFQTSASSVSNVSGIDTYYGYQVRHAEGYSTLANNASTHTEGYLTIANNFGEHASGVYNNSTSASTTFGDSGNTLFSVGNGTPSSARHNAFEIRQNGDIYLNDGSKLQDTVSATAENTTALGGKQDTLVSGTNIKTINGETLLGEGNIEIQGGGGSITIDQSLDSGSTNPVANSAITNALHETYFYNLSKQSDNKPETKFSLLWKYIDTKQTTSYNPFFVIAGINGTKIASLGGNPDRTNFELVETSAITTSISSSSTDAQIPSAKAVYDMVGNINTILESI